MRKLPFLWQLGVDAMIVSATPAKHPQFPPVGTHVAAGQLDPGNDPGRRFGARYSQHALDLCGAPPFTVAGAATAALHAVSRHCLATRLFSTGDFLRHNHIRYDPAVRRVSDEISGHRQTHAQRSQSGRGARDGGFVGVDRASQSH